MIEIILGVVLFTAIVLTLGLTAAAYLKYTRADVAA